METERFLLRPIKKEDAEAIYEILRKEEVIENLNLERQDGLEDTKRLIDHYLKETREGTYDPFGIIDKKTKDLIGVFLLKLDLYNEDAYEYTTYLDPSFWNQGVTTEILSFMVPYFFKKYSHRFFRGYVMEKNKASCRVLEKCHFKLERIFQVDGLEGNIYSYLMTREDYEKEYLK